MRNRNLLRALEGFCARRDVVDGVKDVSTVVSHSTRIANTNRDSFEYDEALLMLESLAVDFLWANRSVAVLTQVAVSILLSGICGRHIL